MVLVGLVLVDLRSWMLGSAEILERPAAFVIVIIVTSG